MASADSGLTALVQKDRRSVHSIASVAAARGSLPAARVCRWGGLRVLVPRCFPPPLLFSAPLFPGSRAGPGAVGGGGPPLRAPSSSRVCPVPSRVRPRAFPFLRLLPLWCALPAGAAFVVAVVGAPCLRCFRALFSLLPYPVGARPAPRLFSFGPARPCAPLPKPRVFLYAKYICRVPRSNTPKPLPAPGGTSCAAGCARPSGRPAPRSSIRCSPAAKTPPDPLLVH